MKLRGCWHNNLNVCDVSYGWFGYSSNDYTTLALLLIFCIDDLQMGWCKVESYSSNVPLKRMKITVR